MAYRTRINDTQIFGNNEYYQEWFDFLDACGIERGEGDSYDAEITDFMGMLECVEGIVHGIESKRAAEKAALAAKCGGSVPERLAPRYRSLYDLSDIKSGLAAGSGDLVRESLFDALAERVGTGYLFMPLMAYAACMDDLEPCDPPPDARPPYRLQYYKLKDGRTIRLQAG